MSVAGLEMYSGAGFYYTSMQMGGNNGLSSGESEYDELLLAKTDTEKESTQQSTKALTQVPYTRCITASYKINELIASQADDGRMIYSYKASEQSFQIYINSDGEKKTYTVSGIDKKGSPFEKEFNPYEVDPENADFPEFAALCMYIKQTDDTADLLANDYFQPDDILERKDYLGMLENFDAEGAFSLGKKMMLCALDLVNSLNEYLNYRMKLSGMSEEERIDLLLSDIDNQTENTEPISESVITRNTEYIDPTTKERIPVDIRYITCYTEDGISCKEITGTNGKVSERKLWSLSYNSQKDYEKVQDFLKSFSDEQNLTFATQEKFWKDFLQDDFDIEEFRAYYNSTENGHVDIEKAVSSGKTIREALTEPYAEYLNNNHFVRHVWTEQEMLDNWHARIDANHKAANAKAPNMPYAGNHVVKNKNEYFAMAKDDIIAYQGAVFMCDRLTDTLTLGDVSDPDKCIRVGLSKGGSLFFNRDNIGSLMDAITMFSPEDQERIVKAIQIDNMAQKAQKEIEDAKSGDNVKSSSEEKSDDLKDE